MQQLAIVFLQYQSSSDTVVSVGTASYAGGTNVLNLPSLDARFFPGLDIDGNNLVCCVKNTALPLAATFHGAGGNYTPQVVLAPPTVVVGFVGGRPNDR